MRSRSVSALTLPCLPRPWVAPRRPRCEDVRMFMPEELEGRSFVMVRRGYDPDEVGAFLRAVADDIRRLQEEITETRRLADPLDGAMTDAVTVVQAARDSAARMDAQA